jgi:NADH:ubiquinone oxidoreductase subunit F (NADH-binding)
MLPFEEHALEKRVVLKNCGQIDPKSIRAFLKKDGFAALEKAQKCMSPEQIIDEVTASGLLGRGGAGFPCGLKWKLAREHTADQKFVICNADESEVGTFKDRYLLENDPFTLIEAIAIAGWAVGAAKAFIYLRAEYHYLSGIILNAIEQAKAKGFLKHLDIELREGAGSYMCGEESGLMNSIEGLRGEARYKPPFPPEKGLWGMPTVIQNVETLMNIPQIILNGSSWFVKMGTERSKGTKVFSVSGDVAKPGVYELELGSTLSTLVLELASARETKMVQVGGACGRIIPSDRMDIPLAYESVLGSGAVTVFGRTRDVIEVMYRNMEFLSEESCGRCTPCRDGSEAMLEILERLVDGQGTPKDIGTLEDLAKVMSLSSLCGLGQTAPLPLMDTLNYFRKEYESRIEQSAFLRSLGSR